MSFETIYAYGALSLYVYLVVTAIKDQKKIGEAFFVGLFMAAAWPVYWPVAIYFAIKKD